MKYPHIEVELSAFDGTALSVVNTVKRALNIKGIGCKNCNKFIKEALSDDYNHTLIIAKKWVKIV